MLVARSANGTIVGAMGMIPPGECRPSAGQQFRILPRLLANGPRTARWLGVWAKQDPDERHWHFGSLAVDAHLQGRGIGSKLMRVFCARMDAAGEDAYLETDKPINVRFYERFGFEVISEEGVLCPTGSCPGGPRNGSSSNSRRDRAKSRRPRGGNEIRQRMRRITEV